MVMLAPLVAPLGDAWLSPLVRPDRSWWLLRDDSPEALSNALAALVSEAQEWSDTSWVVLLQGSRDRLAYVSATDIRMVMRAPGTAPTAAVGPLNPVDAVAVLDRAETAPVTTLLLLVDTVGAVAAADRLARSGDAGDDSLVHLVLLRRAAERWAVVGVPTGRRPKVPGAAFTATQQQLPSTLRPVVTRTWAPLGRRAAVILAAAATACLVVGGLWFALGSRPKPGLTVAGPALPSATVAGTFPGPAQQPSLAYDSRHQHVVLFGGTEPVATWLWSKLRWTSATPSTSPSDRFGAAMAWDPLLQRVLLFGGREPLGTVVNDTWAWDGSTWKSVDAGQSKPPGWEFSGMAWDVTHQQMVLLTPPNAGYAGGECVTWTWSGGGWDRQPTAVAPPAEPSSAMAFDPATQTVLLALSGLSPGATPSTWSWNGVTWRQLHPLHQPDLGGFNGFLTPVPKTGQLLLTRVSVDPPQGLETWTWDGRDWTRQHPLVTPVGVVGLVADDAEHRVIAFGRRSRAEPLSLAWAWTGADWVQLQ